MIPLLEEKPLNDPRQGLHLPFEMSEVDVKVLQADGSTPWAICSIGGGNGCPVIGRR